VDLRALLAVFELVVEPGEVEVPFDITLVPRSVAALGKVVVPNIVIAERIGSGRPSRSLP